MWINSIPGYTAFTLTLENGIYDSYFFNITYNYPDVICYSAKYYATVPLLSFEIIPLEQKEIICENSLNGINNLKIVVTSNA